MLIREEVNEKSSISEEAIEQVGQMFLDKSLRSIWTAHAQVDVPRLKAFPILHDCHFLFPYKLQKLDISEGDKETRLEFAQHFPSHSDGYSEQYSKFGFSNECKFWINAVASKLNARL